MARFRHWFRAHVLNFLRDPDRKSQPSDRTAFRKSILISAPVPIGSLAIDITSPPPPPLPSSFAHRDSTESHPLRQHQLHHLSASNNLTTQPISMIIEDDEPPEYLPLPPTVLPDITERYESEESDATTIHEESPTTRRPTRNFSRRFSRRLSSFSNHSVSSYASSEAKRLSQMSAVSALSRGDGRDEWGENRLSRRWSNRVGSLTPLSIT